jgi:hypothetical protein
MESLWGSDGSCHPDVKALVRQQISPGLRRFRWVFLVHFDPVLVHFGLGVVSLTRVLRVSARGAAIQ